MAKMIHSMIRVLDDTRSIVFQRLFLPGTATWWLDFENFRLVYLRNASTGFELELTLNKGQTTPYDLGDGYGHLAVSVDDLDAEHTRLQGLGLAPRDIVEFAPDGVRVARFFFIADPDGYQIEVLERGGRFK